MIQRKEARMAGPNWASIGTLPTGGSNWVPHVAQTIDGHLEVFTLDSQGALWHTRQITPNGHWNPWALVAHPPTNQVGADSPLGTTVNADGRLEVFTFDGKGGLWHIWQQISGGSWSSWTQFDTPAGLSMQASDLTTGQEADGRLMVFFRDSSGALWCTS